MEILTSDPRGWKSEHDIFLLFWYIIYSIMNNMSILLQNQLKDFKGDL